MLQEFSGATLRRTLDRSGANVPEHAHDWPLLSLFVMGSYSNRTELGERVITGPSAVFYAAGAAHRNMAGPEGFEQIEIDPAWLRSVRLPEGPVLQWTGGRGAAEASDLARLCGRRVSEGDMLAALRRFLEAAPPASDTVHPEWMDAVTRSLRHDPARRVADLARETGLHPSWLGTAYRRAAGEGLMEAAARFRVERATRLLRETEMGSSGVAAEAGFCDQSHMVRSFKRVLGRLPSAVREDRRYFRQN